MGCSVASVVGGKSGGRQIRQDRAVARQAFPVQTADVGQQSVENVQDQAGALQLRRCIAGGPDDFMSVYHLVFCGTQVEVGQGLACEARDHCHWQPPRVADPVRNRARRRWFERNWPEHHARMEGVAMVFGYAVDEDDVDLANVMAEPVTPQCSAVWCSPGATVGTGALVGRNMDFSTRTLSEMLGGQPLPGEPPALARPYVIETYPDQGHATLVSTVGDLTACLDGINDRGLVAAVLADDESSALRPSGMPQAGLNEMHLLRYLLETCSSAEEAKEALYGAKQYDEYAVAHYLVADSEQAFVWERDTHNAEYAVSQRGHWLYVTNFLLHRLGVDRIPNDVSDNPSANDAYRRASVLQGGLNGSGITWSALWELLESVRADSRHDEVFPESRTRTLWHGQYDLEGRSVEYEFYLGERSDGSPRRSQRVKLTLSAGRPD